MGQSDPVPPTPGQAQPRSRSFDLYSEITRQITDMLEKGVVPWRSPILGRGTSGHPKNLNTGKGYRGVNVFLLAFTAYAKGYESSYWLTYDQARGRGGGVRKGEKSSMVVFWKPIEVTDKKTGEKKKAFVLKYYNVFNLDQCDGIEKPDAPKFTPTDFKPVEAAERIARGYADGPTIEHGGAQAYYRPLDDKIRIAEPTRFATTEEYYSTLFHELSHSTGHSKRLDRKLDKELRPFGSPDYGKEELVAEMSAAFLCGESGIVPRVIENQAAYISGWLGKIKSDKTLLIHAAGAAARSADWILGRRAQGGAEGQGNGNDSPPTQTTQSAPDQIAAREGSHPPLDQRGKLLLAARSYMQRGFAPLPIPAGQKGPAGKFLMNWQRLRLTQDQLPAAFQDAGNIGLILGAPSGNLVDVDLDCPEAREIAERFLPPTGAVSGRPSSPRSHWWYFSPDLQTRRHRDPLTKASIAEVRGTGSQTLVGPSIHPSGEVYSFLIGEPTRIDAPALSEAVERLATEVIRLRHGELIAQPTIPAVIPTLSVTAISSDHAQVLRRASAYLGAIPPAISGQGGHNVTYSAATALVHGFALSDAEAFELLRTQYNPKCQPPWSEKELLHKVADAAKLPHERERGWLLTHGT